MVVLNSDASYKPSMPTGDGWQELWGVKVTSLLRQLDWVKDDACSVLENRIIDENNKGLQDEVDIKPIYRGSTSGKTKALLLGMKEQPLRVFYVTNDKGFDEVKSQLMRNKGFLDFQINEIGTTLSDNNADAVYTWQDHYFGISRHVAKIAAKSKYSSTIAAKQTEGTRAVVLTEAEATELVKKVITTYGVKNLELVFGYFNGGTLGYVTSLDDATTPFSLPYGIKLWYNNSVIYKHSVLHECAHAIEWFRNGITAHGRGFRNIYRVLLKTYMDLDATGL